MSKRVLSSKEKYRLKIELRVTKQVAVVAYSARLHWVDQCVVHEQIPFAGGCVSDNR